MILQTYLEFIAAQILVLGVLVLLLQPVAGFWEFVGLFALGLESTVGCCHIFKGLQLTKLVL